MSTRDTVGLVVRRVPSWRRRAVGVAAAVILALGFYLVYEWGRYSAGYDRLTALQQRAQQEQSLRQLEQTNRQLRIKIAQSDTERTGRVREQAELARTIGELQAQVAKQAQELVFYQGIVEQNATPALGIKIQQPRIVSTSVPGRFRVRFALVRSGRPDDVVQGTLRLSVDGEAQGKAVTLNLAQLAQAQQRELPISFRYFENIDQEITLPSDFRPERLTIEIYSSRKGVTPLTQSFVWSVDR
jgi:hypothetical protein